MGQALEPFQQQSQGLRTVPGHGALVRKTARSLERLEAQTLVRCDAVRQEATVGHAKINETFNMAHTGMEGEARLRMAAAVHAGADPIAYDENMRWVRGAQRAAEQIFTNTIETFKRM